MYPKFGPGQLWETVAEKFLDLGGKIIFNSNVVDFKSENNKIKSLTYLNSNNDKISLNADCIVSSMPLKDLILGMDNAQKEIKAIAEGLPYRDFVTAGVLVKEINLKNTTNIKTLNDRIPDCWIYVQDSSVKLGRMQFFNNWSPYMVRDYRNTQWIGLEYFCRENDDFWNLSEDDMREFCTNELIKMKIINSRDDIIDFHRERVEKAYPAYFDSYKDIDKIIEFVNSIENLYCIGRNGQHRYNNMDHSMMCGFLAAKGIVDKIYNKKEIWNVNTEQDYHESK